MEQLLPPRRQNFRNRFRDFLSDRGLRSPAEFLDAVDGEDSLDVVTIGQSALLEPIFFYRMHESLIDLQIFHGRNLDILFRPGHDMHLPVSQFGT